jgi:predicted kinase
MVPVGGDVPMLVLVTGPPGTGKSTLAEAAAGPLGASVLSWDWVMAALRPIAPIQAAIGRLDHVGHRRVGWAILWSLATEQLRRGRSVVLDGVARQIEADETRAVAASAGARCLVVVTSCADPALHRQRVEGRDRDIPGWYEVGWDDVTAFLGRWEPPAGADLYLDTAAPFDACAASLTGILEAAPPAQ